MDKIGAIGKEVIKRITPTENENDELNKIIKSIKILINKEIKIMKLPATIELVGSTAKNTYIRDNLDIDIFLLFPTSYSKNEFSKNTISIGNKILLNPEESYAEHPYVRGFYHNYKVEIVPCYKIENASQKLSSVDRTPLHTKYIRESLKEFQKKEVRLLKQFLIGIGCYGAEADVEGFSGYLCEILILKFTSFINLVKRATGWKFGEIFSLDKANIPAFNTPLTFIDPVDYKRNVASALSNKKFELFIFACKKYLENPSMKFFFPNKISPWSTEKIKSEIKKIDALFIGIILPKPNIIIENLYPQIRKAAKSILISSEKYGFKILDVSHHIDDLKKIIIIILKLDNKPLSPIYKHMGPPLKNKKNIKNFIEKWEKNPKTIKKPYEENNRIFVNIKREYIDIKEFLHNNIDDLSLGKHLDKIDSGKIYIVKNEKIITENLRIFWTNYLDGKMIWER